jgi:sigma-B regulation protein RsbU (phosphoserine phosphatase)
VAGADALQEQLQAQLDLAPCGLLRTDTSGVIQRVNLTFSQWVGYERDELIGRKLPDLLTMGARIFHLTHLLPLLQMQGSVSEVKLELVHRDGHTLPMVLNASRHQADGAVFTEIAVFVARDRDKYERELLLARRRLETLVAEGQGRQTEAQDRALLAEQMVGIVSHDLRNPLQTIQMGAMLLTRGEVTPHQLTVLGRISRAAERATRLIADLLDFTQARLGRGIAIQPRPVALHSLVADVVEELLQAYPGRRIVHETTGEGECLLDGDRIAQLVGNLVSNAVTYGDPAAAVTVSSEVAEHVVRVRVHNAGEPISHEAQSRIFQPMVRGARADAATRSVGLGLYIVSEIAKVHGGQVDVASEPATGTTFTATFPRGAAAPAPG